MKIYFVVAVRFVRFWASGGATFHKMGHSLSRTPMNHRNKWILWRLLYPRPRNHRATIYTNRTPDDQRHISLCCNICLAGISKLLLYAKSSNFHGGQYVMRHRPVGSIYRLQQSWRSRCRDVISDWLIPFAAYTLQQRLLVLFTFSVGRTTRQIAPPVGDSNPI